MTDKKSSSNDKKEIRLFRDFEQMTRRMSEMFEDLRIQMNSIFEEVTAGRPFVLEPLRDFERSHLHPLWTIKENPDSLTITVDLPYAKKEQIKLQAEENSLTITAELDQPITFDSGFQSHQETEFQRYKQTLRLPCRIDVDRVKATFQQGILSISVPRKCERRNIPVE